VLRSLHPERADQPLTAARAWELQIPQMAVVPLDNYLRPGSSLGGYFTPVQFVGATG
jgi:hypothetical protein